MKRKDFIKQATLVSTSFFIARDLLAKDNGPVFGHGGRRYKMDMKWSSANPALNPVNDCHEMVQDRKGRILLLTNETRNNVLVYQKSGKLVGAWGHEFPGAHGLTLTNENGTDFLFITDTAKHQVYKTTIDGKIVKTVSAPLEAGVYKKAEEFVPTETAVDTNGDFFIADGYGAQYITHYDKDGKLKNCFGGRGEGDEHLDNAHGITIDRRLHTPTLLITDRTRNCFKRFSMDGKLLEIIKLPGACVCRPVIKGDHLYAAVLRSPSLASADSGFVTILDKENKVVSNIGGTQPVYKDGVLQPMSQSEKIFRNPHDVCVDDDENLYVAQWASGKVYPYKFTRV
ncbi:6-bladed beta-propeller [Chitinophaga sp.]|uniref:6-bladed beta-propeller n=1 Tax=Chitinophaga sp. TaxID=1869181 RepID=UPI0031DA208E